MTTLFAASTALALGAMLLPMAFAALGRRRPS